MTHIEQRLENWGRAMRPSAGGTGKCGSAEGRYIPERGLYTLEERREPRVEIDQRDAALVEAAWRAMGNGRAVSPRQKLLTLHFVRRCPWDFICRRRGIPPDRQSFELALGDAIREIARNLEPQKEVA